MFSLKLFVLCACLTSYVQDIILYTGSMTQLVPPSGTDMSGQVVCTLLEDYLNHGHILYMDNWYTSALMADFLHNKTGICGTVKRNWKHMPHWNPQECVNWGDVKYFTTCNILAISWVDKREVNLLSTIHEPYMVLHSNNFDRDIEKYIRKPAAVLDYNTNMRLVDKFHAMISSVKCAKKIMKWYRKLFIHLLDLSTHNANILYRVVTER